MDNSFVVPDPSDWLQTPVSLLGPVESALRCQVCKDFFNTPMITSCSHTFCSLCIRRCLTTDGRCPSCRAQDQEIKLRPNPIVQELVDTFQVARPVVLQLGEAAKKAKDNTAQGKRKRESSDTDSEEIEGCKRFDGCERRTRSQYRKTSAPNDLTSGQAIENEEDGDFELDDGLSACPICSARMKEEEVFPHLDIHNGPDDIPQAQSVPTRTSPHFSNSISSPRPPPKAMERLPQLNYSLLRENALRKKLSEIGISNGGPRALLIRRHTEWVNLVNANCDSTRPRTKRELLQELDVWDKTQGRHILNSSAGGSSASSVMKKDFDGAAWAASHDQDFQSLIAKARRNANPKLEVNSSTTGSNLVVQNDTNRNKQQTTESASDYTESNGSVDSLPSADRVTFI